MNGVDMLRLSDNAVAALENARAAGGVPDSYGLRLSGNQEPDGHVVVNLAFVEGPDATDQVTEQSGTEVYVAPEVADPLSTAVLDVLADDEAGLQLVFRDQQPGD